MENTLEQNSRKQLVMDYFDAFGTKGGERVLADLSAFCFDKRSTFVPEKPTSTAFNEGRRDVILRIRQIMAMDPYAEQQQTAKG